MLFFSWNIWQGKLVAVVFVVFVVVVVFIFKNLSSKYLVLVSKQIFAIDPNHHLLHMNYHLSSFRFYLTKMDVINGRETQKSLIIFIIPLQLGSWLVEMLICQSNHDLPYMKYHPSSSLFSLVPRFSLLPFKRPSSLSRARARAP